MPDTKSTPTVTVSDRAAAIKALPCFCEPPIPGQHTTPCPTVYAYEVASEIAAAREASVVQHTWVPDPHRCLDCGGQPEAPQHAADLWARLEAQDAELAERDRHSGAP